MRVRNGALLLPFAGAAEPRLASRNIHASAAKMESACHLRRLYSTLPPTLKWPAHRSRFRGVQQTDRRTNGHRFRRLMSPTPSVTGQNNDRRWSRFEGVRGRQIWFCIGPPKMLRRSLHQTRSHRPETDKARNNWFCWSWIER